MSHDLEKTLSKPRFQTYLDACAGDAVSAEALYIENMHLSGAALEAIHVFEVAVRNRIDGQLRIWNAANGGSSDWALLPTPFLAGILDGKGKLTEARSNANKALRKKRTPNHDDVVAQLALGTWRYLLPSQDPFKQKIWDEAVSKAFPNNHAGVDILKSWIEIVYDLRNRVAHFEPIFSRDLRGKRRAIRDVLNAMSKEDRIWYLQYDPFLPAIDAFYGRWPQYQ